MSTLDLSKLPLVLCGPMLRRVTLEEASVQFALKEACTLTLRLYEESGAVLMEGQQKSTALGAHLHYALVTAKRRDGATVEPGRRYRYEVTFEVPGQAPRLLTNDGILALRAADLHSTYDELGHRFHLITPPEDPARLRVMHGSCRKPHGQGRDAMALVDQELEKTANWPHLLLLTGDQIYADDVHPWLLKKIRGVMHTLLGDAEARLVQSQGHDLALNRRAGYIQHSAGLSTGEGENHLVTLAEFYGMYLLAWSTTLWGTGPVHKELQGFFKALPAAQRALAHLPTYMICDDHEVTDDWFISQTWTQRVLGKPEGRRVLRNALSAYALFQHAGNVPADFAPDRPGGKLLTRLKDNDGTAHQSTQEAIERHLGLVQPGQPLSTELEGRLHWSWKLTCGTWEVIGMDTRGRRDFPNNKLVLASTEDLEELLPPQDTLALTLLLSPTPVLGIGIIEAAQGLAASFLEGRGIVGTDAECWARSENHTELLEVLLRRGNTVILSGDVHYGFSAYAEDRQKQQAIINFTNSALKNQSNALVRHILLGLKGSVLKAMPGPDVASSLQPIPVTRTYQLSPKGKELELTEALVEEEEPRRAILVDPPPSRNKALGKKVRSVIIPQSQVGLVYFDTQEKKVRHELLAFDPQGRTDAVPFTF